MKHSANVAVLFWLVLVALLGVNQASAAPAPVRWYEHIGSPLSLDEVQALADSQWQSAEAGRGLNLGFSDSVYWIKVQVPAQRENRVLEISYPLLDEVDLYWVHEGRRIGLFETGDTRPFATRPVNHRNFVFPVPLNQEPLTAYLRVKTQGAVQVPVELESAVEFLAGEQLSYGWQTMFLGIIVALALYNLFLYSIIRQPTYLWYVLTVVLSGLVHLHLKGILFQWLWPDLPGLNRYITIPLTGLTMIAALVFSLQFLAVAKYSRASHRFLQALMVGAGLSILLGLVGFYQTAINLVAVLAAIATPAAWLIGIYVWSRGQRLAGLYVLAWTPLLLGHLILAVSKLGYLPTTFLTEFGPQIGVAIEVILLSFALAYRINLERRRRLRAQEQALDIQRRANLTLEERVRERTEELERANRRLEAISLTDGLTQVANRRQFDECLKVEWCRIARQGLPISLLLLDIDYFKAVNDRYGHLVGDDCLITVAAICANEIQRSGDLLARYGGEEFAVLLPATPSEGAEQVAERLRQAVENATVYPGAQEAAVSLSVSIGVATQVPGKDEGPGELVRRADAALYGAKEAGRNRVMTYRQLRTASAGNP